MRSKSGAKTKNNEGSIGTLGKSHKPYETTEKMKMAKQATTKLSFLTLSGSKISSVVTAISPKSEGDYDVKKLKLIFLPLTASISIFKVSTA